MENVMLITGRTPAGAFKAYVADPKRFVLAVPGQPNKGFPTREEAQAYALAHFQEDLGKAEAWARTAGAGGQDTAAAWDKREARPVIPSTTKTPATASKRGPRRKAATADAPIVPDAQATAAADQAAAAAGLDPVIHGVNAFGRPVSPQQAAALDRAAAEQQLADAVFPVPMAQAGRIPPIHVPGGQPPVPDIGQLLAAHLDTYRRCRADVEVAQENLLHASRDLVELLGAAGASALLRSAGLGE